MRRQPSPSPVHFSNPSSEDSPPPSPSGDHANEEHEYIDIPMASPSPLHTECEEFSTGAAHTRANTNIDVQIDLNDNPPVRNSPKIVHIKDSDEEIREEMAKALVDDIVKEPVQQNEQCIDKLL